jgi:hypothetical protein
MRTNTETSPNLLQLGQHLALDDNLDERKTITRAFIVINFDDLPFSKYFILNYVILLRQSQFCLHSVKLFELTRYVHKRICHFFPFECDDVIGPLQTHTN